MLAAFAATTIAVFLIVLLHWPPWNAVATFYDRTVGFQFGRASPFSLWDWRQYHAKGVPDLHILQRVLEVLLVLGALVLGWCPRYRSPLRLAAFTGLLLVGFELVLTHWFYLYLPWFFPFVALALVAPLPSGGLPGEALSHGRRPPPPVTVESPPVAAWSAVAAALFVACFVAVHYWFWAAGRSSTGPVTATTAARSSTTASSRTATSRSSTRPARSGLRAPDGVRRTTRPRSRCADGDLRRRD